VEADAVPRALLGVATSSEDALLEWLKTKVSRLMIEEISANDWGEDTGAHLAGILAQLAPHPPLGLPPWHPREVLELERWSEPDQESPYGPPSGERGHLKRLLACEILPGNGAYVSGSYDLSEEDFFLQTSAATLLQLTGSALALGIPDVALGFVLWLFEKQFHPGVRPFTAFCALALASFIGFGEASEQEIIEVCDWVDAEEARCRNSLGSDVDSERWLTGVNSYEGDRRAKWLLVANQAFEHNRREYSTRIRERLRQYSDRLAESSQWLPAAGHGESRDCSVSQRRGDPDIL
jgi:hypothetical protein